MQLSMFPDDVAQFPTPAMKAGKTVVYQCSWCGALLCAARAVQLERCPVPHPEPNSWWPQPVEVGPFRHISPCL